MSVVSVTAVLAVMYVVTGWLGLSLAIGPGYASAVFPAAGIALGAVLCHGPAVLPGVFIGSATLNLAVALDAGSLTPSSAALALLIALGATTQALVGRSLIVRRLGHAHPLEDDRSVVAFLALGGPVACITSASVGVCGLVAFGVTPLQSAPFSVFTWWIGDTLGVLVFTPLMVAWLAERSHGWSQRRAAITLPVMLAFGGNIAFFTMSQDWHAVRVQQGLERVAEGVGSSLRVQLREHSSILRGVDALYSSSAPISNSQFRAYASRVIEDQRIQALEWIPRVPQGDLPEMIERTRADGLPGFDVWERSPSGERLSVSSRPAYFPVTFLEPLAGNEQALGFDLASNPDRRAALERSRDSGTIVATGRITLVQETERQAGILIFAPIFQPGAPIETVQTRREQLLGFALGVFRLGDTLTDVLALHDVEYLRVALFDRTNAADPSLLAASSPDLTPTWAAGEGDNRWISELTVGGRDWALLVEATPRYLSETRSYTDWALLVVGMTITALTGAFLLITTGRSVTIGELVERRTRELSEANTRLEEATRVKSRFLANMSHELRTPMGGILGLGRILEMESLTPRGRNVTSMILRSAEDLLEILNSILDFSKLESEMMRLEEIPFSLRHAFDRSEFVLRPRAVEQGIDLVFRIDDDVPDSLLGDPTRLRQIVINLVGNAIKFTPAGSVSVHVTAHEATTEACTVRVEVADTGIGIPREQLKELFQAFSQADASMARKFGGTGLGLAITDNLVRLMGGTLSVQSEPEVGTTFTLDVRFPISVAEEPSSEVTRLSEPLDQRFSVAHPMRILVAEDNEINQQLVTMILGYLGYEPHVVGDGAAAVRAATDRSYDLILMDMQMPRMSGVEATRRIREATGSPTVPHIIALTANAFDEDRRACLDAGMNDFLTKPFQPEELAAALLGSERAEPPTPAARVVLDRARLETLSALDPAITRGLLSSFLSRQEGLLEAVLRAADASDGDQIEFSAHAFKGVAANVGATALADVLEQVERRRLLSHDDRSALRREVSAASAAIAAHLS